MTYVTPESQRGKVKIRTPRVSNVLYSSCNDYTYSSGLYWVEAVFISCIIHQKAALLTGPTESNKIRVRRESVRKSA